MNLSLRVGSMSLSLINSFPSWEPFRKCFLPHEFLSRFSLSSIPFGLLLNCCVLSIVQSFKVSFAFLSWLQSLFVPRGTSNRVHWWSIPLSILSTDRLYISHNLREFSQWKAVESTRDSLCPNPRVRVKRELLIQVMHTKYSNSDESWEFRTPSMESVNGILLIPFLIDESMMESNRCFSQSFPFPFYFFPSFIIYSNRVHMDVCR